MDPTTFGILRQAVREARSVGYSVRRLARPKQLPGLPLLQRLRVVVMPDGAEAGTGSINLAWLEPYFRQRALSENLGDRESYKIGRDELSALKLYGLRTYYATTIDGEVQFSAYEHDAFTCEMCEERADSDDARTVYSVQERARSSRHGHSRTEMCVCASCVDGDDIVSYDGELFTRESCTLVDDDFYVPDDRLADNYYYWESDGEWHSQPEEDEENEEDDGANLHDYGTNVIDEHGWPENVDAKALCFGVELEVEPKCDTYAGQRRIAVALCGRNGENASYILASDGSLVKGVELITVPQTLAQHKGKGGAVNWAGIADALKRSEAISGSGTTRCGMHVHINRAALTSLQVGKMLVFVNSHAMRDLVTRVAQRQRSDYLQISPKKFTDVTSGEANGHYDALNITGHGTLELRIFRGNTRLERILKNIEFAAALCLYCRDASMLDVERPEAFLAWLQTHRKAYPHLHAFLNDPSTARAAREDDTTEGN